MDTGRGRPYRDDVSSPGDAPRDDDPRRPAGWPQEQQSRPYGATPYDDGAAQPPYVYNPYGNVSYPSSYPVPPAGLGQDDAAPAVRRPGSVHLALGLLLVSALPYLFIGLLLVTGAGAGVAELPPEQLRQLQELGVDPAQLVRTAGTLLLAVALVFLLIAVLAWTGRRWARGLLAALTAGFVLLLVASFVAAGGIPVDGASLVVGLLPLVLAVVGVALMFGAGARAWFARPRGRSRR